jgi:hypothetical protein
MESPDAEPLVKGEGEGEDRKAVGRDHRGDANTIPPLLRLPSPPFMKDEEDTEEAEIDNSPLLCICICC